MTRASANSAIGGTAVAALHATAGAWRIVIAQGPPARVLEARTLAQGATRELDELLRERRVTRLVRLIPGPRTIVRCVSIPQAAPADAAAALSLIAEAELPDSIPAHRRAAGLIPAEPRAGSLIGLLTGWPARPGDPPEPRTTSAAPESWATAAAALAALRGQSSVAVFADAEHGSIAILAGGPNRTVARILVEDNSTPDAWAAGRERAIAETLRSAGVESEPPLPGRASLMLEDSAITALAGPTEGKSSDPRWMDDYGLALGAAMLALSDHPAERSLADITDQAPRARRDPAERAIAWLSVRRNAWRAAALAAVALFLLPLGLAWARVAILDGKVGALRAQEGSREELARSAALYEVLQKSRWPMSKLLADVSGALPVGVRVGSIRLAPDQGLGLEASADSPEAVGEFQQNLNKTGIFRDVRISRSDTAPGGSVTFEIDAAIPSPFLSAPPAEDFAAQPLAVRLYGEGASNTHWSADADTSSSSRPARPARTEAAAPSDADEDSGPSAPSRPSGSGSDEVPLPLTDDQIQAMEWGTSMKEWSRRKTYPTKTLDQATKDRLASEVGKLKVQMDAKKPK